MSRRFIKMGRSTAARERLRRRYRPDRVRILFVGEAPPASDRFFYQADSGLYRAIRDTFVAAFPAMQRMNFLESFRSLGCYLVDLCGEPVDRLDAETRKQLCGKGEVRLSRILRDLQPKIVVSVVRSIARNVRKAELDAHWFGLHFELPYPGRWIRYRVEFRRKLVPLLRKQLKFSLRSSSRDLMLFKRAPCARRRTQPSPKPHACVAAIQETQHLG